MKTKKLLTAIILMVIISCSIGYLLGRIFELPGVKFDDKLNPMHGISVLVTMFGIVFISIVFDRHKEVNKIKKDVLLKRIDELYNKVESIRTVIEYESNTANHHKVKSILKEVGMMVSFFNKILENAKIDAGKFSTEFISIHRDSRHLMTYTELKTSRKRDQDIKIKGEKLEYSHSRLSEIEINIESLKNCIMVEQMRIITY